MNVTFFVGEGGGVNVTEYHIWNGIYTFVFYEFRVSMSDHWRGSIAGLFFTVKTMTLIYQVTKTQNTQTIRETKKTHTRENIR